MTLPILVALLGTLLVVAVIGYPLVFQQIERYHLEELQAEDFSERKALVEALSELEQSHRMGKISNSDYEKHRGRLEREYVEVVEEEGTKS